MADPEQMTQLGYGPRSWNTWVLDHGSEFSADLRRAEMQLMDLRDVLLSNGRLGGAILRGSDLTNAVLDSADLKRSDLQHATLDGASMRFARLVGAECSFASFRLARLFGADLTTADLRDADVTNCDLRQVIFDQCDLSGADLTGSDLAGAALGRVVYDFATTWPEGFTPPHRSGRSERDAEIGTAPPRAESLTRREQSTFRSSVEPFAQSMQFIADTDDRLDDVDERYLRSQLKTIAAQSELEDEGDPEILERAIVNIVNRFLGLLCFGKAARAMLAELEAEPPELVDRIVASIDQSLRAIVEAGVSDPKRDGEILAASLEPARNTLAMLEAFVPAKSIEAFQQQMGKRAADGAALAIAFLAHRYGPGFETAALRLIEAWPTIVQSFTRSLPSPPTGQEAS